MTVDISSKRGPVKGDRGIVSRVRKAGFVRGASGVTFGLAVNTEYTIKSDDRAVARFEQLPPPPEAVCIPLLDLPEHRCKFPIGAPSNDGVPLFCGAPEGPNKPYCIYPAGIAYNR